MSDDILSPEELAICRIKGTWEIPLGQIPQRFAEVPVGKRANGDHS